MIWINFAKMIFASAFLILWRIIIHILCGKQSNATLYIYNDINSAVV